MTPECSRTQHGCERLGYADRDFPKVCRYIGNLDKDPEFQAIIRAAADAEESRKRQAEEAEAARKRRGIRATLDVLISEARDFATSSPEKVLAAIDQGGSDPYAIARGNLEAAEQKLDESVLGPDAEEYRTQIQELKPRVDAVGLSYVMMMSIRSNQSTKAVLRKTSPEELEALKLAYNTARSVALELRAHGDPDGHRAGKLVQATTEFSRVLRDIEDELLRQQKDLARREQIRKHMRFLCVELPKRQRALQEEIRYKREVDRESGTRDLALDRELAMEKIELREMRKEAMTELNKLGAPYSKSKCSKDR